MRKLKTIALAIVACLVLTGCGCEKKATTYTVTFDSNGGTAVASQKVEDGKTVTSPTNPTRDGFTFDGWYLNDVKYDFSKKVTSNFTLVGKWTATTPSNTDDKKSTDNKSTDNKSTDNKSTDNKSTDSKTNTNTNTNNKTDNGKNNSSSSSSGSKTVAVTGISLNTPAVTLTVGGSDTLTATVAPSNATNKAVTWTSSDTNVVTVDNGKITAVAAGTATITAKAGDKTATVTVTVNEAVQSYTYENKGTPSGYADLFVGIVVYDSSNKDVTSTVKKIVDAEGYKLGQYNSSTGMVHINKDDVNLIAKVVIGDKTYDLKQK